MKFPFFSKPAVPTAPKPPTDWQLILEKLPVGSTFNYLGIDVTVIYSSDFFDLGQAGWDNGEILCRYVDASGTIRSVSFMDNKDTEFLSTINPK